MEAWRFESRDIRSDVPDFDKKKDRRYPFSSEKRRSRDSMDFLINSWLQRYRSSRTESKKSSQYLEKREVGKPTTSKYSPSVAADENRRMEIASTSVDTSQTVKLSKPTINIDRIAPKEDDTPVSAVKFSLPQRRQEAPRFRNIWSKCKRFYGRPVCQLTLLIFFCVLLPCVLTYFAVFLLDKFRKKRPFLSSGDNLKVQMSLERRWVQRTKISNKLNTKDFRGVLKVT